MKWDMNPLWGALSSSNFVYDLPIDCLIVCQSFLPSLALWPLHQGT
jgi:hypothetical protein